MILPIIRSSLVVLVLTFVIATSSVIGTGYVKKVSSSIFSESETVQASDANQNIIERIANLQKQINELRRQIATLPGGGETKDLVSEVITVPADMFTLPNNEQFKEGTAHCPEGKIVTGGGFAAPLNSIAPLVYYDGPGPGQSWSVKAFDTIADQPDPNWNVFAICASLE